MSRASSRQRALVGDGVSELLGDVELQRGDLGGWQSPLAGVRGVDELAVRGQYLCACRWARDDHGFALRAPRALGLGRHVHGDLEDLAGVPVAQDAQQLGDVTPAGRDAAGAQELPRVHEQPFSGGCAVLQVCGERDHRAQVAGTRDVIDRDRCADVLKAPDLAVPVLRGAAVALDREVQQPLGRHADVLMRGGDQRLRRAELGVGSDDLDAQRRRRAPPAMRRQARARSARPPIPESRGARGGSACARSEAPAGGGRARSRRGPRRRALVAARAWPPTPRPRSGPPRGRRPSRPHSRGRGRPARWSRARVPSARALDCGARSSYRLRGDDSDPRQVGCRGGFVVLGAVVAPLLSGVSPQAAHPLLTTCVGAVCLRCVAGVCATGGGAQLRSDRCAHARGEFELTGRREMFALQLSLPSPLGQRADHAGSLDQLRVGAVKRRQATLARRPVHGVSSGTRPRSSNRCSKPAAPCARSQAYSDSRYSQIEKPHCFEHAALASSRASIQAAAPQRGHAPHLHMKPLSPATYCSLRVSVAVLCEHGRSHPASVEREDEHRDKALPAAISRAAARRLPSDRWLAAGDYAPSDRVIALASGNQEALAEARRHRSCSQRSRRCAARLTRASRDHGLAGASERSGMTSCLFPACSRRPKDSDLRQLCGLRNPSPRIRAARRAFLAQFDAQAKFVSSHRTSPERPFIICAPTSREAKSG